MKNLWRFYVSMYLSNIYMYFSSASIIFLHVWNVYERFLRWTLYFNMNDIRFYFSKYISENNFSIIMNMAKRGLLSWQQISNVVMNQYKNPGKNSPRVIN